jgi:ABC-type uncharacterized transport system permease subunit
MDSVTFFTDYLMASVRLSIPLAFAAIGGLWAERSGVINIGLEGMLLSGAFLSAATASVTENVWWGIVMAAIGSGLIGLFHAYLCVSLRVQQLVSGLAINLCASGLTAFGSRIIFRDGHTLSLPTLNPVEIPGLKHIPILGTLLFQQDILLYLLLGLVILSTYLLFYSAIGLSVRAVGEYPRAADTAGVSVRLIRYLTVTLSGSLAGLGGAYLTLVHVHFFTEGMTAGKGFIALAAIIFGKWHPVYTFLACLLFGATEALQLRIQAFNVNIPYQFLVMLPYAIALLAMIGLAGKCTPPSALGVPYVKESRE